MKYIYCALIFLLLTSSSKHNTIGLNDTELADRIKVSLKSGNYKLLSTCLDHQIELIIDSDKIDFQKIPATQAEQIFKSFFQRNPPVSFQYVYQGSSNKDLRYSVGSFKSRKKDYLVYMLLKKTSSNKYVINTLQFREG